MLTPPSPLDRAHQMTAEARLEQSLRALPSLLERIWNSAAPASERRALLFATWDQAAEPDDPELGAAGAYARDLVEEFVRARLPEGAADAFSADELQRLNRSRRGSRFAPYAAAP